MAQRGYDPYDPYGNQNNGSEDPGNGSTGGPDPGGVPPIPTPVPAPTPPPATSADPWETAPADGNWQAWFQKNMQGTAPSPAALAALKDKLAKAGVKVLFNAQGNAGKIQLPNGKIIDVGTAFSSGDPTKYQWSWQEGPGEGGFSWDNAAIPAPDAYTPLDRPDYLQGQYKAPTWQGGDFQAPDAASLQNDPGYQARLAAAQKSFERGAAAKGTLLSGGSQIALGRQQQGIASDEYGKAFGRAFDTYQQKYGQFRDAATADFGARQLNESAYKTDADQWYNRYATRYKAYRDAVGDNQWTAEQGKPAPPPS